MGVSVGSPGRRRHHEAGNLLLQGPWWELLLGQGLQGGVAQDGGSHGCFVIRGPGLRPWQNQVEDMRRTKRKVKGACVGRWSQGGSGGSEHGMKVGTERRERLLHPRSQPPDSGLWVTDPQPPWTTESGRRQLPSPQGQVGGSQCRCGTPQLGESRNLTQVMWALNLEGGLPAVHGETQSP